MWALLTGLLKECKECEAIFNDNIAVYAGDSVLTDEQCEAVLLNLTERHKLHDDVF